MADATCARNSSVVTKREVSLARAFQGIEARFPDARPEYNLPPKLPPSISALPKNKEPELIDDDKFFDVPRVRVRTSSADVEFPIQYRDASAATALFGVDYGEARQILASSGLVPLRFRAGKAVTAITWFEYRDTSIGPYNELSIAVLACRAQRSPLFPALRMLTGDPRIGAHILHLPVTTDIACAGGREVYGYPKTVCEIPIEWSRDGLDARLVDDGRDVLSMKIPFRRGLKLPMADLKTFSELDGHPITTVVKTNCQMTLSTGANVGVSLGEPKHAIVRTLTRLGIGAGDDAAWTMVCDPFKSLLPIGEPVQTHVARAA